MFENLGHISMSFPWPRRRARNKSKSGAVWLTTYATVLQDAPRRRQVVAKTLPRRAKITLSLAKTPQDAPRRLQDLILMHFGKPNGDKLAPKPHPAPILRESSVKAQNYYFCSTRGLFHVFDLSKFLHRIQCKSVTKYHPREKSAKIPPRAPKTPARGPKMPQDGSKSLSKTLTN